MKNSIKFLLRGGIISKDNSFRNLSNKFLQKARANLTTMNILYELKDNKKAKRLLNIAKDYNADEWVVVSGYYSMYSAALALIAAIGFRSKTHTATFRIVEKFYVEKKILHKKDLKLISEASLKKEELESLSEARHKREIAQYSVTKQTTKEIADKIKSDAYAFVNKVEEILLK